MNKKKSSFLVLLLLISSYLETMIPEPGKQDKSPLERIFETVKKQNEEIKKIKRHCGLELSEFEEKAERTDCRERYEKLILKIQSSKRDSLTKEKIKILLSKNCSEVYIDNLSPFVCPKGSNFPLFLKVLAEMKTKNNHSTMARSICNQTIASSKFWDIDFLDSANPFYLLKRKIAFIDGCAQCLNQRVIRGVLAEQDKWNSNRRFPSEHKKIVNSLKKHKKIWPRGDWQESCN